MWNKKCQAKIWNNSIAKLHDCRIYTGFKTHNNKNIESGIPVILIVFLVCKISIIALHSWWLAISLGC